ncbi:MAG: hypothetical protein ABI783_05495, partial [Actinomycetota bacterium]
MSLAIRRARLDPDLTPDELRLPHLPACGGELRAQDVGHVLDLVLGVAGVREAELAPKRHHPVTVDHRHAYQEPAEARSLAKRAQKRDPRADVLEDVREDRPPRRRRPPRTRA